MLRHDMGNTFDFILTPEQFSKSVWHRHRQLLRTLPFRRTIYAVSLFGWLMLVILFSGTFGSAPKATYIPGVAVAVAMVLLISFLRRRGLDRLYRRANHLAGVPCRLIVEETGLRHSSPGCESMMLWSRIASIEEVYDVLILRLDDIYSLPIPVSAFASKEEKEAFLSHVRGRIASAVREPLAPRPDSFIAPTEANTPAPEAAGRSVLRNAASFFANLANGFRLMFFRRVEAERIDTAWWQVAAFALAGLFVPFLYDLVSVGFNGYFEWWEIPSALVHVPVILFAAIASACVLDRSEKTLLLLQMFFMIAVAVDLAAYASLFAAETTFAHRLPRGLSRAYAIVPVLWLGIACARAAANFSASFIRGAVVSIACFALLAGPLVEIEQARNLWQSSAQAEEADPPVSRRDFGEDALYNQPKLLDAELAAVRTGRPGDVDVYFIGVAGYSNQDVFMKEVEAVSEIFRSRFGSTDKTIRLVNNRNSTDRLPIATVTSLGAALNRVGQIMDRDEDVLFLFLTSHGSETHRFSLDFWPLKLKELDPAKLRALLDESGVKNRVVVVSACYSGGFIEPLKDENTLVITASAADKNSFGCSNEAEWTYFGKAYFDEALRQTYSFAEAFEIAKPLIAEREKKDGYKASEPQIALGEGIKRKLQVLERQLAAGRAGRSQE